MRDKVLGIDLGTTGCKAMIMSPDTGILGQGYIEYGLIRKSSTYIEQDPFQWWELTKEVIHKAIQNAKIDSNDISALSISSQGISFVPVDEKGNPLMNAISWLDTRAEKETKEVLEKFSMEKIFSITGKRVSSAYMLPKLLWLRKHKPDLFKKTYKFLMGMDFLLYKLTGKFVTDHSMASGSLLYDIVQLKWSSEILETFKIPVEKLSRIEYAGTSIGQLTETVASEIGLSKETLVVVGGQDQKCAALVAGIDKGIATISLGTASAITSLANRPIIDKKMRIPCFPFVQSGKWVLEGVISTAGASLKWFKDTFYNRDTEYSELIPSEQVPKKDLIFMPFLAGAASPYWNDELKGAFYGITLSTTKSDMAFAILEGIAYNIKANIEVLKQLNDEIREVKVFGSGAKSKIWLKIISNVLAKKVYGLGDIEMVTLGACLLAGIGKGIYDISKVPYEFFQSNLVPIEVETSKVEIYQHRYDLYCELISKLLKSQWN